MKYQILSAAAALVASAAAAPRLQYRQQNVTIADGTPFALLSIRSGSDLQYGSFSAANGGLLINAPEQGATCEKGDQGYATFYLNQGELNLYTPANITQKLYTDRSGMGQGVLQYSTSPGGYGPGRNSETKGWAVDRYGDLTFDGASLLACRDGASGPYSVWVSAGVTNPAGYANCTGIAVRTSVIADPNACIYTYTPITPITSS